MRLKFHDWIVLKQKKENKRIKIKELKEKNLNALLPALIV